MEEAVAQVHPDAAEKAIEFPAGLFGFPNAKHFLIVDIPGGGDIFKQMVALDQPDLAFTLVNPLAFFPDYAPDVPDEEVNELGASEPDQIIVMLIANVPKEVKEATANLKAPLLFNPHARKGRQVILTDERYTTRQRLFKV